MSADDHAELRGLVDSQVEADAQLEVDTSSRTAVSKTIPYDLILAPAFGVVAVALAVAIIIGASMNIRHSDSTVAYATNELRGMRYSERCEIILQQLLNLEERIIAHHTSGHSAQHSLPSVAQEQELTRAIDHVSDGPAITPLDRDISTQYNALTVTWGGALRHRSMSPQHIADIIAKMPPLMVEIADDSGITNDPSIDGINFGDALIRFPLAASDASRASALATINRFSSNTSLANRLIVDQLLEQASTEVQIGKQDIEDEVAVNADLGKSLEKIDDPAVNAYQALRNDIQQGYVVDSVPRRANATTIQVNANRMATTTIDVIHALSKNLRQVIQHRIEDQNASRTRVLIATSLGVLFESVFTIATMYLSLRSRRSEKKRVAAERKITQVQHAMLRSELRQTKAQQAMVRAQSQFKAIFDHVPTGMIILNRHCGIVDENAAARVMFANQDECRQIVQAVTNEGLSIARVLDGEYEVVAEERAYISPDSQARWFDIAISPVHNEADLPTFAILMLRDITDHKSMQSQLVFDAEHDALTKLPNRQYFLMILQRAINQRKTAEGSDVFSVVFIDFNDFKTINDSFGHQTGDAFLIQQAQRLSKSVRSTDVVARIGGDEFAIILHGADNEDIQSAVVRLQGIVAAPLIINDNLIAATASFGIAQLDLGYSIAADLIRDADTAMYKAKAEGGRTFAVFDDRMRKNVVRRMQMSMDITKAIENDELLLLYQPIVDLQNGRIAGCEALIRWQRSDGVIVAPSEFIPLAEENGSIIEIGQWVIETACRQMAQWNTLASRGDMQGLHEEFAVHVNLAVPQVHHPDILENLKRAVDESHIPRHKFILEITEGIVLKNTDETHATLQALTAEGFRLSIDDFGTGYSSLRYLNELPFHSFKIDKSFVSNELAGLANASIVEVLMLLSRSLDLDVVAEGIETEQQWIALRDLGCKFGQGYFFAQPLTAADLTNKLATTSYAVEQRPM